MHLRRAMTEGVLGMGAVVLAGVLLRPEDPLLLTVHPHPLWAIILLVAVRYGNPAGFLCAALSCALHVGGSMWQGMLLTEARAWGPEVDLVFAALAEDGYHCKTVDTVSLVETSLQLCEEFDAAHPELELLCQR